MDDALTFLGRQIHAPSCLGIERRRAIELCCLNGRQELLILDENGWRLLLPRNIELADALDLDPDLDRTLRRCGTLGTAGRRLLGLGLRHPQFLPGAIAPLLSCAIAQGQHYCSVVRDYLPGIWRKKLRSSVRPGRRFPT